MDFFISAAMAQDAGGQQEGDWTFVLLMVAMVVIFYFLLIRPQSKRQKEHRQMVEALKEGDEVLTQGGILGRITKLDEQFVTLEIADGVRIRVQRHAVGSVVPKGTFEE